MSATGNKVKQTPRIEPSEGWVWAQIGDEFVVDRKRPLLVWAHKNALDNHKQMFYNG